jgi:trehalose/maltose transport system substrate-binding protein
VRVAAAPSDVDERLGVYEQLLGVQAPGLDVLEIDVTWPGVLAEHLVDLSTNPENEGQGLFPVLLDNNRVGGRLVALPWFLDFGLLYYRKDLLEAAGIPVPGDWDGLADSALAVQTAQRDAGNGRFWGFVWQGWRSESLVCNAMEWLQGAGAGHIIEHDGEITVGAPPAIGALKRPVGWIGSISPESVLSFAENESLAVFAAGDAAFMRNWPGAWAVLNADDSPVAGKVGIAPLPKSPEQERHPATLGGWQLAVSRYSRHPDVAADLVRYLTSPDVQRRMALEINLLPTRFALYQDDAVQAALPASGLLGERQVELVARPSAVARTFYPRVSQMVQQTLYDLLSGNGEAQDLLPNLAGQLRPLVDQVAPWNERP